MGFTFPKPKGFEIEFENGEKKVYPFDPSDYGMMHGIMTKFPDILHWSLTLRALKRQSTQLLADIQAEGADLLEINQRKIELDEKSREALEKTLDSCVIFLKGTLGEAEYEEIFAGRRLNVNDLIALCTSVYEWAVQDRQEALKDFVDEPTSGKEGKNDDVSTPAE